MLTGGDHPVMSILEKKQRLMDDLGVIEDPHDRLAYVIDFGKRLAPLDETFKTDAYRIEGCVSNLWLHPQFEGGVCRFDADSDALITKGFAGLLCWLYSGFRPEEVLQVDPAFLGEAGVTQHLSPNRRNGLTQVGSRIMNFAKIHAAG
jgi:cysteine desulfuration protein SufE